MNYIFILTAFLFIHDMQAQCKYSIDKTDEYTHVRYLVTGNDRVGIWKMGKPELQMSLARFESGVHTSYMVWVRVNFLKQPTCLANGSKVILLDDAGVTYELTYPGDLDCAEKYGETYTIDGYFDTSADELKLLATKVIQKARVVTAENTYDFELRINNNGYGIHWFANTVNCVLKP